MCDCVGPVQRGRATGPSLRADGARATAAAAAGVLSLARRERAAVQRGSALQGLHHRGSEVPPAEGRRQRHAEDHSDDSAPAGRAAENTARDRRPGAEGDSLCRVLRLEGGALVSGCRDAVATLPVRNDLTAP